MVEWLLVYTLNIVSDPRELRDVSAGVVSGFRSKETCNEAARKLAETYTRLVGHARMQRGIAGNSSASTPAINYECVEVRK